MSAGRKLREQLSSGFVVAPSVYDGLTALIAQRAGFGVCHLSGEATAAQLGFPDVHLTGFSEVVDNVRYVSEAVRISVIADADSGFGNVHNVARTVREYEAAGAGGLHLSDETFPRHSAANRGEHLLPIDAASDNLRAALDTRSDPDFVIIARTYAMAPHGWNDTLERVAAYRGAGVDLVFVDGIEAMADLARYAADVASAGPTLYNGALVPTEQVGELGFSVNIAGGGHVLSYLAVRDALLRVRTGSTAEPARNELRFGDITSLLGLDEVYALEARYATTSTEER
jgi:2-methylisocitrate lyase-like PEP mutase family enzyme